MNFRNGFNKQLKGNVVEIFWYNINRRKLLLSLKDKNDRYCFEL